MRTVLKHIVQHTYRPLLIRYLGKTRKYSYGNIHLQIPPEVFHPGFFTSTHLLLQYISDFTLAGKRVLELGAGSGLIAMHAARKGAAVTATDINPIAIEYLYKNSHANNLSLEIIQSDLFAEIRPETYDIIAINPPYYKKNPVTAADHAWYCGENGEYFQQLFQGLKNYMGSQSEVLMVCCDGCDLRMIEDSAAAGGFNLQCMLIKPTLLEKNFIFKITQQ